MTLGDDLEQRLERFGEAWRRRPSLDARVLARIEASGPADADYHSLLNAKGWTMTQRITVGGLAVSLVVCLLVLFGQPGPSAAVLAQVTAELNKVTSYTYRAVTRAGKEAAGDAPDAADGDRMEMVFQWKSPGSIRMETKQVSGGREQERVRILHRDRPGLEIDRQAKSYRVEAAMGGYKSPLMMVENLGAFRGAARQELGRKQISGSAADGFVLELRDIDPSAGPGAVELWVDADAKLPVLIEIRQTVGMPMVMRMDDFEWNVELDDALFDATPPAGFSNTSPPPEDQKEFVEKIKAALKLYSELSGGHYPRGTMIYGDVTRDEMLEMSGLKGPIQPEWLRDKRYERVLMATGGLGRANTVLRDNLDAAYHGAEVGPRDAEKVLLRWRLDDGAYQVIYGDLSDGVVGRERLRELER